MAKSIVQKERECLICGDTYHLELHHIFYGTANRKLSDKYGLTCYLCKYHHTGRAGIHFNKEIDDKVKRFAQTKFEEVYKDKDFLKIFGRNYL